MITEDDIATAVIIAMIIIVIAVFVWPGYGRITTAQLEGHWSSQNTGSIFQIKRVGRKKVDVYNNGALYAKGFLYGLRAVRIVILETGKFMTGSLEFASRQISWDKGQTDTWIYQGVR
jgi:hypothetical protein